VITLRTIKTTLATLQTRRLFCFAVKLLDQKFTAEGKLAEAGQKLAELKQTLEKLQRL
jgi:hypothetical protein